MIQNDPLNRKWLDISIVNPHLMNEFRPALVSFLGFNRNKRAEFMGSGFVIGGDKDGRYALVFTAKHVLDGIRNFQRSKPIHAPSVLSEFIVHPKVSIEPLDLKVVWMGQKDAKMLNVAYTFFCEELDIACCIVTPQETEKVFPQSIPLDCRIPSIGDTVHMISYSGMRVSELDAPQRKDGFGQQLELEQAVNIRIGTVTGIYEAGFRQYNFPCFTTSIPAEPGMSGGFLYLPENGATIAACGIVSADNSSSKARTSMMQSGESVIACTWPALGLSVPESIPVDKSTQKKTIYDMIKTGRFRDIGNNVEQIEVIKLEGDDCRVKRKI